MSIPFFGSRVRVLFVISVCAVALTLISVWAGRQQAGAAPRMSGSTFAEADKGGITPTGAIIFVNSTSDGANSADGLCTLREAISNANTDSANLAVPGECTGGSGPDTIDLTGISGTIVLDSALPLIDSEITLKGPGAANLTIQRSTVAGTPNFRIFTVKPARSLTMNGTTVSNGSVVGAGPSNLGGNFFSDQGATLIINNSVVKNATNGGGISNFAASVTINNSTISGNGGVPGTSGSGAIINSVPFNNPATAPATVTINNSTISGNNGTALSNNVSIANVASPATITVNNSTISGNNIDSGGGGAAVTNGVGTGGTAIVNLNNCTISGNTNVNSTSSTSAAGAIYNIAVFSGSNPTNASVNITNSTIFGNTVGSGGSGGIQPGSFSSAPNFKVAVLLRNSIVAGNTAGAASSDIAVGGVDPTSSFNLIGTGGSGGLVNGTNSNQVGVASPGVGPLANNGGPTMTNALLSTSPAIDAGSNIHANSAGLTTDQRGFNRIVDGPDVDTEARVDIGAYESQAPLANLPDASTLEDTPLLVGFDPGDTSTIASVTATSSESTLVPNDAAHLSVAITGSTGAVTICPAANLNGTSNITVTINRTGGGIESKTFQLTVTPVNDAPTYAGANSQTVLEDAGPQTVPNWMPVISPGGGPDEAIQNLTFIVTNNTNPALFSAGPAISSNGTLTYTPAANANGTAFINIVLKDDAGTANGGNDTSASGTFFITVTAVNDAPSFTKGADQTLNEDAGGQAINNWATGISVGPANESQSLTFQIVNNTNTALFSAGPVVSPSGTLTYTPAANANGSATITINLKDTGGTADGGVDTSASQTFNITLNAVNDVPSFTKGPNQTVNEDAGAQTVNNWATGISPGNANESGQTVNFNVTNNTNAALFSAGPAISPTGTLTYTPAADANGSATITINLKDDGGTANGGVDTSASQTFTITVNSVNDAPSFTKGPDVAVNNNAGNQNIVNWATNISVGPVNEAGQSLSFQVTANTNPGLFNGGPQIISTGMLSFAPATNAGGTATITFNLKDGGGTANGGVDTSASQTFTITVVPVGGTISFASANVNTTESSGAAAVTVNRSGDTSRAVTVDYTTSADNGLPCANTSGVATPKCDFTTALGTLSFAAGETSKTITVLISQDSFVEGPETLSVTLSNQTNFAALASPPAASITIADDVTEPLTNPIDDARNFVRQHYHDFLNREPDASGWDFWTNQITSCGTDVQCNEVRRIDVSASFFLSIEFQQTGYLVERFYKVGYGNGTGNSTFNGAHTLPVPIVRANEFLTDTQRIGKGVIVLQPGWEQVLENNKQAYALEFVQTSRFLNTLAFPATMPPATFADKMNQNAGNVLSASERQAVIDLFGGAANTFDNTARAKALRMVADDVDLYNAEFNRAFVLAQYFGYLRRNPNDAPDADYTGYDFWLTKLNQFNGNYINAEMVKAFLSSIEYRQRFGS